MEDLAKIDGKMRKEHYLNIKSYIIPSGKRIIRNNFVFMHENYLKHPARICKSYLEQLQENGELKLTQ